jgi:tripartite-type tricarboxylate transporter receptor subunit TctC
MNRLLTLALAAAGCLYFAAAALAAFQPFQPYPGADSVILNPFDPSDEGALLLLTLQPYYRAATGRNFAVQDMPGRGGATAWVELSGREGSAYNLALTDLPNLAMLSLVRSPAYTLRDIRNICVLASMPLVLWVAAESPARDIHDLIDSARERPGQVRLAGLGRGTIQHLATLRFNRMAGVKFAFSPYTGTESSRRAVLEGKSQAFWGYPSAALAGSGTCRPLAVAAEQRPALFPDLPTFMESGYGLLEKSYFGLAVSGQTDARVSAAVGTVFLRLAANRNFQSEISAAGFTPIPVGASELNEYLQNLLEYYTRQREEYELE